MYLEIFLGNFAGPRPRETSEALSPRPPFVLTQKKKHVTLKCYNLMYLHRTHKCEQMTKTNKSFGTRWLAH